MRVRNLACLNRRAAVLQCVQHYSQSVPPIATSSLVKEAETKSNRRANAANLHSVANSASKKSASVPKLAHWSSPNDDIYRNIFSSEKLHAWSLLEACLELGNMARAESILYALKELTTEHDLTLAVNMYLKKLLEVYPDQCAKVDAWMRNVRFKLPQFRANDVTEALMLKNASQALPARPELVRARVENLPEKKLISILQQRELLGHKTINTLVEFLDLDKETKDSLIIKQTEIGIGESSDYTSADGVDSASDEHVSTESSDTPNAKHKISEPLKKLGLDSLTPTSSVGLASIRYALQAFVRKNFIKEDESLKFQKARELANLPNAGLFETTNIDDYDFFEIYKNLKTEKEQQEFEEVLEEVNMKRQMNLETRGLEAARMKWKHTFQKLVDLDQSEKAKIRFGGIDAVLWRWHQAMMPAVLKEVEIAKKLAPYSTVWSIPPKLRESLNKEGITNSDIEYKMSYGPYLILVNPENLPAMTMMELIRLHSQEFSLKAVSVMERIGRNVEKEYAIKSTKKTIKEIKAEVKNAATASDGIPELNETAFKKAAEMPVQRANKWPIPVLMKIGSTLLSIFLHTALVDVTGTDPVTGLQVKSLAPAFYHTNQYQRGSRIGVIKPNDRLGSLLNGERHVIHPQLLPMLCKPKPWTSWNNGGYWYSQSDIIRTKCCPEQEAYIAAASERNQLDKVCEGLNVLGQTEWTINKTLLKTITEIWNSKKPFLDIPAHVDPHPDLSHIERPSPDCDPGELRDYRRRCREAVLHNGGLYSQRCDLNYKLDIARALVGEKFYLPHNLDFRGRAYPLSPHLNHLGNDVSRSLLLFWKGKKLGPRGLWWLKVHMANLVGENKISHEERVKFVDDNMKNVIASATDPMAGTDESSWWQKADNPFQVLAACIEIKSAMECPEGHENFVSHLTVHQDGSCNGLQHYAALGGDIAGAQGVNLERSEKPQDVYSRVLDIVKRRVQADMLSSSTSGSADGSADGSATPRKKKDSSLAVRKDKTARLVFPHLTRKVVKQPVMTHVYGVTFVGAREQISHRLHDIPNFPEEEIFNTASYLAKHVLESVRELFQSAHHIQEWLADNAERVCKSVFIDPEIMAMVESKNGTSAEKKATKKAAKKAVDCVSSVIWTNRLGMPIVQPYRKAKPVPIKTELQAVYITNPYSMQEVNARKQKSAFPPNYVHSLDGSHMLMTALAVKDEIVFASVHDSYWTHACDVDKMNTKLRECFVDLHSVNLTTQLRNEFQERYKDHFEVMEIPSDCEVAKLLKPVYENYHDIKLGRNKGKGRGVLKISELLDLEAHKSVYGSALDIVRDYGVDAVRELAKKSKRPKQAYSNVASSEHTPDLTEESLLELEEIEEAEQEDLELDESDDVESPKKRRSQKVIPILLPFHVPAPPERGDFDVRKVLDSPYFFS